MVKITRRQFLKKVGLASAGIVGSLCFPEISIAERVDKELIKRTIKHRLEPLTQKIIYIESNWDYWKQREDTKATGLMQIRPIVVKEWNEHGPGKQYNSYDLFDPYVNVQIGEWYLQDRLRNHYLPHYGLRVTDENLAASFNAGPVRIGNIGDAVQNFDKLPEQTQDYLKKLWSFS